MATDVRLSRVPTLAVKADSIDIVITTLGHLAADLLGPSQSVKCVQEDGSHEFMQCSAKLFSQLQIDHPAAHLINSAVQAFHKKHGFGSTTLAFMIAAWWKAARSLQDKGIPTEAITYYMQEGLEFCLEELDNISLRTDSLVRDAQEHVTTITTDRNYLVSTLKTDSANPRESEVMQDVHNSNSRITSSQEETHSDINSEIIQMSMTHEELKANDYADDDISWFFPENKIPDPPRIEEFMADVSSLQGLENDSTDSFNSQFWSQVLNHEDGHFSAIASSSTGVTGDNDHQAACTYVFSQINGHKNSAAKAARILGQNNETSSMVSSIFEFDRNQYDHECTAAEITSRNETDNEKEIGNKDLCKIGSRNLSKEDQKNDGGDKKDDDDDKDIQSAENERVINLEAAWKAAATSESVIKEDSEDEFDDCFEGINFVDSSQTKHVYERPEPFISQCNEHKSKGITSGANSLVTDSMNQLCSVKENENSAEATWMDIEFDKKHSISQNESDLDNEQPFQRKDNDRSSGVVKLSSHAIEQGGMAVHNASITPGLLNVVKTHTVKKSDDESMNHLNLNEKLNNRLEDILARKNKEFKQRTLNRSRHHCDVRSLVSEGKSFIETQDNAPLHSSENSTSNHESQFTVSNTDKSKYSAQSRLLKNDSKSHQVGPAELSRKWLSTDNMAERLKKVTENTSSNVRCLGKVLESSRHLKSSQLNGQAVFSDFHIQSERHSASKSKIEPMILSKAKVADSIGDEKSIPHFSKVDDFNVDKVIEHSQITYCEDQQNFQARDRVKNNFKFTNSLDSISSPIQNKPDFDKSEVFPTLAAASGSVTQADADKCQSRQELFVKSLITGLTGAEQNLQELLVRVCMEQQDQSSEPQDVRLDMNRIITVATGAGSNHMSQVVCGVVIPAGIDTMTMVHRLQNSHVKCMLLTACSASHRHLGYHKPAEVIRVSSLVTKETDDWLQKLASLLSQFEIQALLVRHRVDPEVRDLCAGQGIVLLEEVPYTAMLALSEATGKDMAHYLEEWSQDSVAEVILSPWKQGAVEKISLLHVNTNIKNLCQTVVLCHQSEQVARMQEESFLHCAWKVSSALESGLLLPGGGQTEHHLANWLENKITDFSWSQTDRNDVCFRNAVYTGLMEGLCNFVDQVDKNTISSLSRPSTKISRSQNGMSRSRNTSSLSNNQVEHYFNYEELHVDTRTMLKYERRELDKVHQVVISEFGFANADPRERKLYDSFVCKVAAWKAALSTVHLLLLSDHEINTGQTQQADEEYFTTDSLGTL